MKITIMAETPEEKKFYPEPYEVVGVKRYLVTGQSIVGDMDMAMGDWKCLAGDVERAKLVHGLDPLRNFLSLPHAERSVPEDSSDGEPEN